MWLPARIAAPVAGRCSAPVDARAGTAAAGSGVEDALTQPVAHRRPLSPATDPDPRPARDRAGNDPPSRPGAPRGGRRLVRPSAPLVPGAPRACDHRTAPPAPPRPCPRPTRAPVLPGAEPVDLPGGPVGVLLCHGFTGTHAERAARGPSTWPPPALTVVAPRAARARHPLAGHERHRLRRLVRRGRARLRRPAQRGAPPSSRWACRWAAPSRCAWPSCAPTRSPASSSSTPRWAPSAGRPARRRCSAASCRRCPGIASDIKKPGVTELAYDRVPLRPFASLQRGLAGRRAATSPGSPARCSSTAAAIDHVVRAGQRPHAAGRAWPAAPSRSACSRTATTSRRSTTTPRRSSTAAWTFVRAHAPAAAG